MTPTNFEYADYPTELIDFIREIVHPLNLKLANLEKTTENAEYGGTSFTLHGKNVQFRVAKTTPSKAGQFVALYKRCSTTNKIIPFGTHDNYDYVFVATSKEAYRGIFIFDHHILVKQGILTSLNKPGKLAFRVYAPWVDVKAAQAIKTKQWQSNYFMPFPPTNTSDEAAHDANHVDTLRHFKKLFSVE